MTYGQYIIKAVHWRCCEILPLWFRFVTFAGTQKIQKITKKYNKYQKDQEYRWHVANTLYTAVHRPCETSATVVSTCYICRDKKSTNKYTKYQKGLNSTDDQYIIHGSARAKAKPLPLWFRPVTSAETLAAPPGTLQTTLQCGVLQFSGWKCTAMYLLHYVYKKEGILMYIWRGRKKEPMDYRWIFARAPRHSPPEQNHSPARKTGPKLHHNCTTRKASHQHMGWQPIVESSFHC